MINNSSSSCHNCMHLIRMLVLDNIIHYRRIFAKYVRSEDNELADALSRLQFLRFWRLAPRDMNEQPTTLSEALWPMSRIWIKVSWNDRQNP